MGGEFTFQETQTGLCFKVRATVWKRIKVLGCDHLAFCMTDSAYKGVNVSADIVRLNAECSVENFGVGCRQPKT